MSEKLKVWLSDKLIVWINIGLFSVLSFWWVVLFFYYKAELAYPNLIWAASYQSVAILGAIWGFVVARRWGGFKSVMGRAIMLFAFGLFFQVIGQSTFSYYGLFTEIDIPYPSIADIGFFGSVIFYIAAAFELYKSTGARSSIKSVHGKLWAMFLPAVILGASYFFFLRGYEFDWTNPLIIFLDFGYPLGEAIYVSIAILAYLLSRNLLGGIMRNSILIILGALVMQYIAEFNFLYTFLNETWINGGYGDFLYLLSYFVMSFGLIRLGTTLNRIKQS